MGFRFGEEIDNSITPRRAPPSQPYHPDSYQSRQHRRFSTEDGARDSLASTEYSPISTTFPQNGLAPRPPSYGKDPARGGSYRRSQQQPQLQPPQQQQQRGLVEDGYSDGENDFSDLPPIVPDAPRAPPPVSYKSPIPRDPQTNVSERPTRSRSGRSDGPRITTGQPPSERVGLQGVVSRAGPEPQGPTQPSRRNTGKLNVEPSNNPSNIPRALEEPSSPSNALNNDYYQSDDDADQLTYDPNPQPRREWAPDRSPLQKLELTLQDITKEEKRARVEEAEMIAREAIARRAARAAVQGGVQSDGVPLQNVPNNRGVQVDSQRRASVRENDLRKARDQVPVSSPSSYRNERQFAPTADPRYSGTSPRSQDIKYQRPQSGLEQDGTRFGEENPSQLRRGTSQKARDGPQQAYDKPRDFNDIDFSPVSDGRSANLQRGGSERTSSYQEKSTTKEVLPRAGFKGMEQRRVSAPREVQTVQQSLAPRGPAEARMNELHGPGGTNRSSQSTDQRRRGQAVAFADGGPLEEWRNAGTARLTAADLMLESKQRKNETDQAWWERQKQDSNRRSSAANSKSTPGYDTSRQAAPAEDQASAVFRPPLYLKCGPLLRYLGIGKESASSNTNQMNGNTGTEREFWRGSIMIVTTDSESSYEVAPTLRIFSQPENLLAPPPSHVEGNDDELAPEYVDPIAGLRKLSRTGRALYVKPVEHLEEEKDLSRIETDEGLFETVKSSTSLPGDYASRTAGAGSDRRRTAPDGESLGKVKEVKGHRLYADRGNTFWRFNVEIELGDRQARIGYRINRGATVGFWVPAKGESMNIMFHSCNGFSLSVNPDQFSGPDPLWRDVLNTHQTRPFHVMIGGGDQIYNDAVTKQTNLFRSWLQIRNPLHKHSAPFSADMRDELENFYFERYSMWFSQGLFSMANSQIPMINIWDDHDIIDGFGSYPHSFMSTPVFTGLGAIAFKYYMLFQHQSMPGEVDADEPSWLLGAAPGPYITERSRSIFTSLGKNVAFLGLDCRTERTRDEVLTEASYDAIFDRCRYEIKKGDTKHLIVLLGVPIAYPRLVWLENLLTSRVMDPVKAMGRAGAFGGFVNQFDGGVEILDDLDDHWTAKNHKAERNWFIEELQELAAEKSVRITILGGDVHLAAIGQFYSNPKLGIRKDKDHRYMPNVISSAIVNTPPPEMLGDILNKRNKIHHFDEETDEDMIPMFTHDVDDKPRNNKRLLPRRNWCSIREYNPGSTPPPTPPSAATPTPPLQEAQTLPGRLTRTLSLTRKDILPSRLFRRNSRAGPQPADGMNLEPFQQPPSVDSTPIQRNFENGYFPPQPVRRTTMPAGGSLDDAPPVRPTPFHRQTTDLLEGKMKRRSTFREEGSTGGDFVDLRGGLDIALNLEISPKDPAGVTKPYRLLVPALWYDGPPDVNPLDIKGGRKWKVPTWKEMGMKMRRRSVAAPAYDDDSEEYEGTPPLGGRPGGGNPRLEPEDGDYDDIDPPPIMRRSAPVPAPGPANVNVDRSASRRITEVAPQNDILGRSGSRRITDVAPQGNGLDRSGSRRNTDIAPQNDILGLSGSRRITDVAPQNDILGLSGSRRISDVPPQGNGLDRSGSRRTSDISPQNGNLGRSGSKRFTDAIRARMGQERAHY
ncbi:MAG: hypothetical protein M4579_002193 [Chaenotheca gracillima]|nr:MAG: hypothetical protein M4579_002193 [Chaenotheca gracillima]